MLAKAELAHNPLLRWPLRRLGAVCIQRGAQRIAFLAPFAAGNFFYIGAADRVTVVSARHGGREGLLHLAWFGLGLVGSWWGTRIHAH